MTSDRRQAPERTHAQQVDFAMQVAFNLLEARPRSEQELVTALRRKNVPDEVAEHVMARLRELGYIDDEAFARTLTTNRIQRSGHGHRRIRQELRARGVDAEVAAATLAEVDQDDEWAAARAVAAKRIRAMSGLEEHVALRRLQGALARRGFSSDIVLQVAREAVADRETSDG